MKFKRGTILIVALIIIFILLIWSNDYKDYSVNSSLITNNEVDNRKISIKEKIQKKKQSTTLARNKISPKNNTQSKTKELSYFRLYQYFKLAQQCEPVLNVLKRKKGLIEDLVNEFQVSIGSNSRGRQKLITSDQKGILLLFVDECINLQDSVIDFEEVPSLNVIKNIASKVKLKMLSTKAVTAEEKELKEVLMLIQSINEMWQKIWEINQGEQTITQIEQDEIRNSMDNLNNALNKLYQIHPDNYHETEEFEKLFELLQEKEEFLETHIQVDKKLLTNEIDRFILTLQKLSDFLTTSSSFVFKEAYKFIIEVEELKDFLIFNNKWVDVKKPLLFKSKIAKELQYTDKLYFDWAFALAVDLYDCYLGSDCSKDSRIMRNYCLGNFNERGFHSDLTVYKEACNSTVEEFYLNYFISPNLLEDVNQIFNYLVQSYAH